MRVAAPPVLMAGEATCLDPLSRSRERAGVRVAAPPALMAGEATCIGPLSRSRERAGVRVALPLMDLSAAKVITALPLAEVVTGGASCAPLRGIFISVAQALGSGCRAPRSTLMGRVCDQARTLASWSRRLAGSTSSLAIHRQTAWKNSSEGDCRRSTAGSSGRRASGHQPCRQSKPKRWAASSA